jgi:hypothetical protein
MAKAAVVAILRDFAQPRDAPTLSAMRLLASSAIAALLLPLMLLVMPTSVDAAPCPGLTQAASSAAASKSCAGAFVPVSATRIYNSHDHNRLHAHKRLDITVTGHAGVPNDAVAVVLNVHAKQPTQTTNLSVWPKGTTRPHTTTLKLFSGHTSTAMTVSGIGADGAISVAIAHGKTEVMVDVLGYYIRSATKGKLYHPAKPFRLFDSRSGASLGNGESRTLKMPTIGDVPATKMRDALVTVTAVGAVGPGHLSVYRAGDVRPSVFTLKYTKLRTVSNQAITQLRGGKLTVTNVGARTDVVVDVVGWFASRAIAHGQLYSPLRPVRVLDTRDGRGAPQGFVNADAAISFGVAGVGRVLPKGAKVAVMTLTATHASADTYLKAWPTGGALPTVVAVRGRPDRATANFVAVKVGTGGDVSILNGPGTTHVVADIVGYYRLVKQKSSTSPGAGSGSGSGQGTCGARFPGDPCTSVYYGASVQGGQPAALEAKTGRGLSLYRSYMTASTPTSKFVSRATDDVANGRIPLISTKVPGTWAQVAAGQQDAWLLDRIRGLAKVNGPVWLALHHEPSGDGAPADWVKMQQHAHRLIEANSKNIALVGILNGWEFRKKNGNPEAFNMPVGTGVDIMGFDSYNNWSPTNGKKWEPPSEVFSPGVTIASWGYPTLVGEYGVRTDPSDPGRAAAWMTSAYDYAAAHHFVGLSYFDSGQNSPDGPWTLDTERMLAFRQSLNGAETAWL